jgi:hypothetical protein
VLGLMTVFLCGGSVVTHFLLERENKKRRSGARDYLAEGKSEKEIEAMGDVRPDFIYVT